MTTFNDSPRWTTRRAGAVSAVVLGHVAVLLIAWQWKAAQLRQDDVRRTITLRLIPLKERTPIVDKPQTRDAAAPRLRLPTLPELDVVHSIVLPAEPSSTAVTTAVGTSTTSVATAPGKAASGAATLALKPARDVMLGSLANPATSDPRSNSPQPTFEERIAMGLDPNLCIKLERLPDGTVKRRLSKLVSAQTSIQNTYGVGARGTTTCE